MELKWLSLVFDAISYEGVVNSTDLDRWHTELSGNVEFTNDVLVDEIQGSSRIDQRC